MLTDDDGVETPFSVMSEPFCGRVKMLRLLLSDSDHDDNYLCEVRKRTMLLEFKTKLKLWLMLE